jgi:hypothetical protein
MQPDGIINALLPHHGRDRDHDVDPSELKINPGETKLLPTQYTIKINPPTGQEIFKIFASENQIDLEDIANTKGESRGGNLTALEKIIRNSYNGVANRGEDGGDGLSYDLLFRINPKP